jgi:hypothetical protein
MSANLRGIGQELRLLVSGVVISRQNVRQSRDGGAPQGIVRRRQTGRDAPGSRELLCRQRTLNCAGESFRRNVERFPARTRG